MTSLITALKEMIWLSCLLWGILLMISAVAEGVPYTSIAIRNEFWQETIGSLGLFLAMLGGYLGFSVGKTKTDWLTEANKPPRRR
jgi:hypothetical protein